MVRAKFRLENVTSVETKYNKQYTYTFYPVTTGSEENKKFWEYTPAGSLVIQTTTKLEYFIPGKEYYLDFSEAPNGK